MRAVLLVLLAALLACCLAQNSTFHAQPFVFITQPFPQTSKLQLKNAFLMIDFAGGNFYMNATLFYQDQSGPRDLHPVYLGGYIYFQNPGVIEFDYSAVNCSTCCREAAVNAPPMCPYMEKLTGGSFTFGAYPSVGLTQRLDIKTSSTLVDPNTGLLMNFFGALEPFSWTCVGVCADINLAVPPVKIAANLNLTVRRALDTLNLLLLIAMLMVVTLWLNAANTDRKLYQPQRRERTH